MDVSDLKGLFVEVNQRMNTALEHLKHEFGGVRTGRASVTILDGVHVDAYGSKMPLNQVAGLSVPEPTLIVAAPVSFLAQPAKFSPASPSISGNSGSQKRRCEQCSTSTPASPNGTSQSAISAGVAARRAP